MSDFETVIGLEVHVQLRTKTKLFCGCETEFGASPNTHVCPVCLGLPGALPVLNEKAIELSIVAGLALDCSIATVTKWDRKQYFYPDLPKGYQISQFDEPICDEGHITLPADDDHPESRRIGILRAHLEEDAGKSTHSETGGDSRIDLNRCGTPLLEIVSHPDMRSADDAVLYLEQIKSRMKHLGVSDCEMQEGSLRVDANVNLRFKDDGKSIATPIVEVKNMNSFRAVHAAILFEADRQQDQYKKDGLTIKDVGKTTRGWDDDKEETFLQREKEESADYRYFPDPDLRAVTISRDMVKEVAAGMNELPDAAQARLIDQLGLKPYDANLIVSQGSPMVAYFDQAAKHSSDPVRTAAWIGQDVLRTLKQQDIGVEQFSVTATMLGDLVGKIAKKELDTGRARDIFSHLAEKGGDSVEEAMKALGIEAIDDSELETIARELLKENPENVDDYKAGKQQAIGPLVGKAKKKNPNVNLKAVRELMIQLIESDAV